MTSPIGRTPTVSSVVTPHHARFIPSSGTDAVTTSSTGWFAKALAPIKTSRFRFLSSGFFGTFVDTPTSTQRHNSFPSISDAKINIKKAADGNMQARIFFAGRVDQWLNSRDTQGTLDSDDRVIIKFLCNTAFDGSTQTSAWALDLISKLVSDRFLDPSIHIQEAQHQITQIAQRGISHAVVRARARNFVIKAAKAGQPWAIDYFFDPESKSSWAKDTVLSAIQNEDLWLFDYFRQNLETLNSMIQKQKSPMLTAEEAAKVCMATNQDRVRHAKYALYALIKFMHEGYNSVQSLLTTAAKSNPLAKEVARRSQNPLWVQAVLNLAPDRATFS